VKWTDLESVSSKQKKHPKAHLHYFVVFPAGERKAGKNWFKMLKFSQNVVFLLLEMETEILILFSSSVKDDGCAAAAHIKR